MKNIINSIVFILIFSISLMITSCSYECAEDIKALSAVVYDEKKVAITFDDGPRRSSTIRLLDGLKERNVTATFFVVGENIEEVDDNRDIIERMSNEGHTIANHTFTHIDLSKTEKQRAILEIDKTSNLIEEITGKRPCFLRPPGGSVNEELLLELDMTSVLWTIDPMDWKRTDVAGIVKDVVDNTKDNSIILLHDIYDTSVAAALEIIDILKNKGYVFVSVEEILIS